MVLQLRNGSSESRGVIVQCAGEESGIVGELLRLRSLVDEVRDEYERTPHGTCDDGGVPDQQAPAD